MIIAHRKRASCNQRRLVARRGTDFSHDSTAIRAGHGAACMDRSYRDGFLSAVRKIVARLDDPDPNWAMSKHIQARDTWRRLCWGIRWNAERDGWLRGYADGMGQVVEPFAAQAVVVDEATRQSVLHHWAQAVAWWSAEVESWARQASVGVPFPTFIEVADAVVDALRGQVDGPRAIRLIDAPPAEYEALPEPSNRSYIIGFRTAVHAIVARLDDPDPRWVNEQRRRAVYARVRLQRIPRHNEERAAWLLGYGHGMTQAAEPFTGGWRLWFDLLTRRRQHEVAACWGQAISEWAAQVEDWAMRGMCHDLDVHDLPPRFIDHPVAADLYRQSIAHGQRNTVRPPSMEARQ